MVKTSDSMGANNTAWNPRAQQDKTAVSGGQHYTLKLNHLDLNPSSAICWNYDPSQGVRPQEKLNLLTAWSCGKIKFCCFSLTVWVLSNGSPSKQGNRSWEHWSVLHQRSERVAKKRKNAYSFTLWWVDIEKRWRETVAVMNSTEILFTILPPLKFLNYYTKWDFMRWCTWSRTKYKGFMSRWIESHGKRKRFHRKAHTSMNDIDIYVGGGSGDCGSLLSKH